MASGKHDARSPGLPTLGLRPVRLDDEAAFLRAHREMAEDGFTFGLGWEPDSTLQAWPAYVRSLADWAHGVGLPTDHVPATFLLAEVGGELVGRTSIRHELNDLLAREGGHIGYGVLRAHRRRGYATEILRQSLVVARAQGVDRVLVTCDDDNVGSATVIESCGGSRDPDQPTVQPTVPGSIPKRRYWFG